MERKFLLNGSEIQAEQCTPYTTIGSRHSLFQYEMSLNAEVYFQREMKLSDCRSESVMMRGMVLDMEEARLHTAPEVHWYGVWPHRAHRLVLALKDRHNYSVIESSMPGQEDAVYIVPGNDLKAKPTKAKARRSQDGEDFTFAMPDGETGSSVYDFLKNSATPFYKPAR